MIFQFFPESEQIRKKQVPPLFSQYNTVNALIIYNHLVVSPGFFSNEEYMWSIRMSTSFSTFPKSLIWEFLVTQHE